MSKFKTPAVEVERGLADPPVWSIWSLGNRDDDVGVLSGGFTGSGHLAPTHRFSSQPQLEIGTTSPIYALGSSMTKRAPRRLPALGASSWTDSSTDESDASSTQIDPP